MSEVHCEICGQEIRHNGTVELSGLDVSDTGIEDTVFCRTCLEKLLNSWFAGFDDQNENGKIYWRLNTSIEEKMERYNHWIKEHNGDRFLSKLRPTSELNEEQITKLLDNWWGHRDFHEMTRISGYDQDNFDPKDGYQEFVDTCDKWWLDLPLEEKQDCYREAA